MLTSKQLKETAIKLIKEKNFDEKCQARIALILLRAADQLDFYDERDTISDSKIGLLNSVTETWKDEAMQCNIDLQNEREINTELRKQIAILKEALYNEPQTR